MDTPLPGNVMAVSTVDTPVRDTFTDVSTTNGVPKKRRKELGASSKGRGRLSCRSSNETRVQDIVPPLLPDTAVPCASGLQRTPDRRQVDSQLASVSCPYEPLTTVFPRDDEMEVVSVASSDCLSVCSDCLSVCSNMKQDSAMPADAEATESISVQDDVEIKPQERHAKEKKRKGVRGFFKRMWKAVKRPFRRSSRETGVQDIVPPLLPDTAVPCASGLRQTTEATESINVQHNATSKRRERCAKLRKNNAVCRFFRRKLIVARARLHRPCYHHRHHRCPHHRCCEHAHRCRPIREICLPMREQISSKLATGSNDSIYMQQCRFVNDDEERKKKGIRGFLRRKLKAVKRPFHRLHRKSKVEVIVQPDTPIQTPDKEQWEVSSVSGPSATESVSLQENKRQEQPSEETCKTPLLSVPSFVKPADGDFMSRYKLEGYILGMERYGMIFTAFRKSDGQKVAVKEILLHDWCSSTYSMAGYLTPVMTEVAMMALMKQHPISPYVVQMLEWIHEPHFTYIIMEYPRSYTQLRKLTELHPLDEKIARVLMRQAVRAAQDCIAHGVFHTDIHAGNILVNTKTLELKLTDFGYALPYTATKYSQHYGSCQSSTPTIYHAVPENVWQLGGLLFEMVYGAHVSTCTLPVDFSPSEACQDLFYSCMKRNPDNRPTFEQILQHHWFSQE